MPRAVILKLAREENRGREDLLIEAEALAKLKHKSVAEIYALQFDHGRPFLAMEYVEGLNLRQWCEGHTVSPRQAARWMALLGEALSAAHKLGVIHRDIKPENMFPKPDCPINPLNLLSSILSLCFSQKCSSGLDSGPVFFLSVTHKRECVFVCVID